jgi:aminomethyltransferase
MPESSKTALHETIAAMGGTFKEDGGWFWNQGFGDWPAEYRAVREDVGVWDVSALVKWEFRGPDAVAAANHVNTNDIASLEPGQVRYGPFMNPDGTMLDEGTVYVVAPDHVLVMMNGEGYADYWAEHLGGFDVTITNVTRQMPHVAIQGPRSREVVQSLTDTDISGLRYFRFLPDEITLGGARGRLARTGYSGELGYEFFSHPDEIPTLYAALLDAGVTPFGVHAVYRLRVEAGFVLNGVDYDGGVTNPVDIGLDRFIKLDSGDFVGRDALAATIAEGRHVYCTLHFAGEMPDSVAPVPLEGVHIGTWRTGSDSPLFGNIGGAILEREHAAEGLVVEVEGCPATVLPWGLYDPDKTRPRA